MIDNNQVKKDASKKLKTLLIIYNYIRLLFENIEEFNTLKIILTTKS